MTTRSLSLILGALVLVSAGAVAARPQDSTKLASFVDPLIGTANEGYTFPGAVVPFGMVSWSPEEVLATRTHSFVPGGYSYDGKTVWGFSLTHLSGAGCSGSGDFMFMPITHDVQESPSLDVHDAAYVSEIGHDREHAAAGFYSVQLQNGVLAELTATTRTGAGRFTYPAGQSAVMLIRSSDNEVSSADSAVTIDAKRGVVRGSLSSGGFCGGTGAPYYTVYFAAHFDHAFKDYGTWKDAAVYPGSATASGGTAAASSVGEHMSGKGSGAYVEFDSSKGVVVGVRVGISYVSEGNAKANLEAENAEGTTFDAVRRKADGAWNEALGRIEVKGGAPQNKTIFYTALYHALLHMNVASDVNGQYRGMDQQTHSVAKPQDVQYANFSGWDVYRSQVQLVTLLFPKVASDMAQSLLNQAGQWGCWSRWTHESGAANVMNGDPSAAAVAAIVAFGGDDFDVRRAYESLLDAATVPHEGHRCSRPRLQQWMDLHYATANGKHDTSVADTLEFSTADFALAQLAGVVGDTRNEDVFLRRAQYWKNLFNPRATAHDGYLQSRNVDGSWKSFEPGSGEGFVEGTGAQYVWMVPFNVRGLFDDMGGNAQANKRLDGFFHDVRGNWALTGRTAHAGMDNEPSVETPWLYDFSGEPYKTQQTVRAICDLLWKEAPDGIPGNDDLGEMSSWYVWAALGMYPEIPGRAELLLSAPMFPEVVVHRAAGDIHITVRSRGGNARYIQALRVDGRRWERAWLPADFVRRGGNLSYVLGDTPNKSWGAKVVNRPPSFDAVEQGGRRAH